jgi:hypothetical protein
MKEFARMKCRWGALDSHGSLPGCLPRVLKQPWTSTGMFLGFSANSLISEKKGTADV